MDTNVLSYGDNLDILRCQLPDASFDLVDLDPPFNSIETSRATAPIQKDRARDA